MWEGLVQGFQTQIYTRATFKKARFPHMEDESVLVARTNVISTILMKTRAAKISHVIHIWPTGRVFETPVFCKKMREGQMWKSLLWEG